MSSSETIDLAGRPRGEVRDGRLYFASDRDWEDVRRRGLFYLRIPDGMDFAAGRTFCETFHQPGDDERRGYRTRVLDGTVLGYSDTGADQVERLQLELALWERHLPAALPPLLHQMNDLSRAVVRGMFDRCGVRPADIATITGGMETNDGLQYAIFNNFESRKLGADGFTPHKDSGFLQLMYIHRPGLEAWEGETWSAVPPLPDHLIAISGHSLEVLTARMATPARACYHRVRSVAAGPDGMDRTSFGIYVGPRFEQDLWQYEPGGRLVRFQSFLEFQRQKATEMGYEFHPAVAAAARGPS